jgi:carbon storage regulator
MLVLSRRLGESIDIDGVVTVTLLEIRDGRVRLGFEADRSVKVLRSELLGRRGSGEKAGPDA